MSQLPSQSPAPAKRAEVGRRTQAIRRAATIDRLVDASVAVLAEHGYAGASVKAICHRAGVSQGALFRHFETRLELLVHVVDVIGARNLESFLQTPGIGEEAWTEDGLERFVRVLRDVSRSSNHAAWREVVAAARIHPDLAEAVGAAVARFEQAIIAMVQRGLPGTAAQTLETVAIVMSILHMFDSEAVTVTVKPNAEIEEARVVWATRVLRALWVRAEPQR